MDLNAVDALGNKIAKIALKIFRTVDVVIAALLLGGSCTGDSSDLGSIGRIQE